MQYVPPPDTALEIIHCDEYLLVVDKPAGLLAVPGRGEDKQDCLSSRLQREFSDALIVHRLDMATSGLLVFARGIQMQRRLSQMFREREMDKSYVALIAGQLKNQCGEINLPIGADWTNRPQRRVDFDKGKPSLTRYRALDYCEASNISRVQLEPVTGRTHQLRVHMMSIGHPIIGDTLYDAPMAERLMLHSRTLAFPHPIDGRRLILDCEPAF